MFRSKVLYGDDLWLRCASLYATHMLCVLWTTTRSGDGHDSISCRKHNHLRVHKIVRGAAPPFKTRSLVLCIRPVARCLSSLLWRWRAMFIMSKPHSFVCAEYGVHGDFWSPHKGANLMVVRYPRRPGLCLCVLQTFGGNEELIFGRELLSCEIGFCVIYVWTVGRWIDNSTWYVLAKNVEYFECLLKCLWLCNLKCYVEWWQ